MSSLLLSSLVFVVVQLSLVGLSVRRALVSSLARGGTAPFDRSSLARGGTAPFDRSSLARGGTAPFDRRVGTWPERAMVGLVALAMLGLLASRYSAAFATGNSYFWHLGDLPQRVAAPVMLIALFFTVSGLLTASPLTRASTRSSSLAPVGVLRITRHPVPWGVVTWSSFHVFANGDAASLVFFGSFLVSGLTVMWLIDRQVEASLGADFQTYAEQTSVVPFVAIARGKNRLVWRELGVKPLLCVLAAFSLIVSLHPWLFGAYPLPGMND